MIKAIKLILLLILTSGVLTLTRPAFSQSQDGEDHESVATCIWQENTPHKKGDCYCGAYGNEAERDDRDEGSMKGFVVVYHTDPLISGEGKNFGCWYLSHFIAPPGYVLQRYRFTTHTDFGGTCSLLHDMTTDKTEVKPENHPQDYQECGVTPWSTRTEVQFKYRIKGSSDIDNTFTFPGDKGMLQETFGERKGRHTGWAEIVLYFVKQ